MFGTDSSGAPLARKLFLRTNSELKRAGPVTISVNPHHLPPQSISVVGGCVAGTHDSEEQALPFDRGQFRDYYLREVKEMLVATPLFDTARRRAALQRIMRNRSLARITTRPLQLFDQVDESLSAGARLGAFVEHEKLRECLEKRGGLTIGVTPSQSGSIAIFNFLSGRYQLPIRIDARFAHTSEMIPGALESSMAASPEAHVMSIASWALLRAKSRKDTVSPLMIMPSASHRVMGSRTAAIRNSQLSTGNYLMMSDFPTTPRLYFEDLQNAGRIAKRRIEVTHADPDETMQRLSDPNSDSRAVLWFPHDVFSVLVHGCTVLDTRSRASLPVDNLLVLRAELASNKELLRLLDIAIRDAWLTLIAQPEELRRVVDQTLSNGRSMELMTRFSGILPFAA
jgi:hypothetical protein